MIAVDAGVLIRYLTWDRPPLAAAARDLIEGDETVGVSSVVLLETIHVVRGDRYGRDNPELTDALVELLSRENVRLTDLDAELALAAFAGVRHLSARHLADALVAAATESAGARVLVTNDRGFASKLVPVAQLGEPLAPS